MTGASLDDEIATTAPWDGGDRDRRPDDGWRIEVNTGANDQMITAYAICAPFAPVRYPTATESVARGERATAEVGCQRGDDLMGGGARTNGTSTKITLGGSSPNSTYSRWRASANNGTGNRRRVTSYAVCIGFDADWLIQAGADTATPGRSSTTVECLPANARRAVGVGAWTAGGLAGELAGVRPTDGSDGDAAPDDLWQVSTNNETGAGLDRRAVSFCLP